MNGKIIAAAAFLCLPLIACKQPVKEAPAEAVVPVDSWIGVELAEIATQSDMIGSSETEIVVAGTIPTMPADGVLKFRDVILRLGGAPAAGSAKAVETIRNWPAGKVLPLTVRRDGQAVALEVTPIAKPAPTDLLSRVYVGRPMPSLDGFQISVAETDGSGGIVPGSQCVMTDDQACPKIGRLGRTNLAQGKTTAVFFWTQYAELPDQPSPTRQMMAVLKSWQDAYGGRGLKIVAATDDAPRTIMPYLQKAGPALRMTVLSVMLAGRDTARLARTLAPCVLILDDKGEVRGAAATVKDLEGLDGGLLPQLLDAPRK